MVVGSTPTAAGFYVPFGVNVRCACVQKWGPYHALQISSGCIGRIGECCCCYQGACGEEEFPGRRESAGWGYDLRLFGKMPGAGIEPAWILLGQIHFYNLNSRLSQPQMLVVSDLEDPFLPLPDDILVPVISSQ